MFIPQNVQNSYESVSPGPRQLFHIYEIYREILINILMFIYYFFIWMLELFPTNIIADMSLADLKFKVIFLFASGVFSASLLFLGPSVSFHLCPFGLVPLLYEAKHLSFNLNFIFKKWKKWQGGKSGMWSRWWAKNFQKPLSWHLKGLCCAPQFTLFWLNVLSRLLRTPQKSTKSVSPRGE